MALIKSCRPGRPACLLTVPGPGNERTRHTSAPGCLCCVPTAAARMQRHRRGLMRQTLNSANRPRHFFPSLVLVCSLMTHCWNCFCSLKSTVGCHLSPLYQLLMLTKAWVTWVTWQLFGNALWKTRSRLPKFTTNEKTKKDVVSMPDQVWRCRFTPWWWRAERNTQRWVKWLHHSGCHIV